MTDSPPLTAKERHARQERQFLNEIQVLEEHILRLKARVIHTRWVFWTFLGAIAVFTLLTLVFG